MRRRANDPAEPRPEWGLADHSAMIVAPRARTRGLDLAGRCFLHDYEAAADPDHLYREGDNAKSFLRTASRLTEMQAADYLALPHLA